MTMEEPWDELMGPPPTNNTSNHSVMGGSNSTHPIGPSSSTAAAGIPATVIRSSNTSSAPPPATMFRNSNSLNLSGSAIALPLQQPRSFHDEISSTNAILLRVDSTDEVTVNTNKSGGSAFDDDHAMDEGSGTHRKTGTDDDDDRSVDSDIGREYDARNLQHDTIRQEALRMLEVADADTNYSVHRTITGGFTAQAKSISGQPRRTKTALQALNFTAQRTNIGKRFSDYATSPSSTNSMSNDRDDYEYGETSGRNVVDMIGIAERSASSSASPKHSNWSSRYSIDSTMLAMSGGSTQPRPWSSDYSNNSTTKNERSAARNLFHNSPASSPQIFGSGFYFRQQHVFGKQHEEKNIHADGIFNESDVTPMNNPRLKTWQDQLLEKKRQQRRCILAILLILMCTLIPMITLLTANSKKQTSSAQNDFSFDKNKPEDLTPIDTSAHDEVVFYVTANIPFTAEEEEQLKQNFETITQSEAHFAIHLGNIHNSDTTGCDSTTYTRVADLIEDASPLPVFIIPGEEDWNDCDDPDDAWDAWISTFELYNQRWDLSSIVDGETVTVFREKYQLENWAFVVKGVLFLGIHVVNGIVPDATEFRQRNKLNMQWVKGMSRQHEAAIRAVVICGNAQPGHSTNAGFFASMDLFWRNFTKPSLYVHSAPSVGSNTYSNSRAAKYYQPFKDLSHVWAAQVEKTADNLPLRIEVGLGENPFTIV